MLLTIIKTFYCLMCLREPVRATTQQPPSIGRECSDLPSASKDGVYTISPYGPGGPTKQAYCYTSGGLRWTVFQRRINGAVDFYRDWNSYKGGFGNASSEYWLGNEVLHALTGNSPHSLKVLLWNHDHGLKFAEYSNFEVGNEQEHYRLHAQGFSGNYEDCFSGRWNDNPFSTKDSDNEVNVGRNCAEIYKGAWWYQSCHCGNLNGEYLHNNDGEISYKMQHHFLVWSNPYYSYKETMMILRPNLKVSSIIG